MIHAKGISNSKKRRIIEVVSCVLFLLLAFLFIKLYWGSKTIDYVTFMGREVQNISYNGHYSTACCGCLIVSVLSAVAFVIDIIYTKIKTLITESKHDN